MFSRLVFGFTITPLPSSSTLRNPPFLKSISISKLTFSLYLYYIYILSKSIPKTPFSFSISYHFLFLDIFFFSLYFVRVYVYIYRTIPLRTSAYGLETKHTNSNFKKKRSSCNQTSSLSFK